MQLDELKSDCKKLLISEKLYDIIKDAKVYNFKNNFLNNILDGGIYLMFEKGERINNEIRVVRVGKGNNLSRRLRTHVAGRSRRSVFRKHLIKIEKLNSEDKVSDYIKDNISFIIMLDPENKRVDLEQKIIGTLSYHKKYYCSKNWLGLKSANKKICSSGLWNVQHVFSEKELTKKDLLYMYKNLIR